MQGGVTTLSNVLAAAASLGIILANTVSAYATQLHLHANYTLATAVMAAQVLPPAPDDGDAAGSGSGHSWQASVAGINAVSRAKQTDIPLVSWRARGGLPVSFSLHHNSKAAYTNPAIGAKWSHTYDTHLNVYPQQNRAAVVWGHQTIQLFDLQGGQWVPRDGYRDRLSASGNGYALTMKSQVRLEFEPTNVINHYRLSRIVDPNGNAIVLTYDSNGLLTQVGDPSGRAIQLQYTGNKLTGVRFAVGEWNRTWTLQYDASGRLQRVYYPLVSTDTGVQSYFVEFGYTGRNNISSFTDRGGNLVGITDPAGNRFDLSYDSANRLTQILEPLVTDAWGNTETARHRTDYLYDTSGNLIEVRQYTDATNYLSTRYGYDSYGQLTTITDARGKVTRYGYDGYGNMVSLTTPLGYQTQWRYENVSSTFGFTRPNARIDARGWQVNYTYDEWGRLRMKTYPHSPTVQYSYDGEGRLVRMVDATGETTWQYTPQGWLASEQKGSGWRVEYSYLPNGLVQAMSEVLSGQVVRTIQYTYTARNLLQTLSELDKTTEWQYDADGRATTVLLGNGARREYTYAQGRLQSIVHKDSQGGVLASFVYSYQQNGRCKQVQEQVFGRQSVVRYGYDFLNRLVREQRTGYVAYEMHWVYDAAGNRVQQVRDGVVTNYTYDDDNRLLSAGSVTYAWDANGNMVSRTADGVTINFGYDEEDRLQRIVRSVAGQMVFTHLYNYDGLGRRFFRWISDSGTSRSVVYRFAGGSLLREQWRNPTPNNHLMMDWKYTWAGGMVNAVNIQWGDQWWSGGDRLGSARVHTDETGSSVTYIGYFTAFGERLDAGFRTAYTFAGDWGYRDDGDAGLLYIGARYYEPAVGRWTSADKWLGDLYRPLSLNRYLYCEDEPVNAVDPSGYWPKWVEDAWKSAEDFAYEYGDVAKKIVYGVLIVPAVVHLAVDIRNSLLDAETRQNMLRTYRDWKLGRGLDDWGPADKLMNRISPGDVANIRDLARRSWDIIYQ